MADDMNEGIKMLLSRIDSHPEEFGKYGKWHEVVNAVENNQLNFLTEEEVKALQDKLRATRREQFTTKIMTELMADTTPPANSPTPLYVEINALAQQNSIAQQYSQMNHSAWEKARVEREMQQKLLEHKVKNWLGVIP